MHNRFHRPFHTLIYIFSTVALLAIPASTAVFPSAAVPDRSAWLAEFDSIPSSCSQPVDKLWIDRVNSIKWVAYSSPNPNPGGGYYRPEAEAVQRDLQTLRKAGFTGLITYASSGIMGKQFVTLAESLGYQGILMGIWSPEGKDELDNAAVAAASPIVLGYSIGNEGLGDTRPRYSVLKLCSAIAGLRARAGKPVATSEDIEMYYRWPQLLTVGDWLFPISHPYWHWTKYAPDAVRWEQDQYTAISDRTSMYVLFKEVGLPTSGAAGLSEANQDAYYRGLAQTNVRFAYFEGFDQPSKTGSSVEPHWGIFNSNLSPKLLAWNMLGYRVFTGGAGSSAWMLECLHGGSCSRHPAGTLLFVGEDRGGLQHRALLSFNTSGLPDNAIVTAVKLKIKAAGVVGRNPITNRHPLVVDICSSPVDAPGAPPGAASSPSAECTSAAGVFQDAPNGGWYTVDLSASAFDRVNPLGATRFQLRLSGSGAASGRAYLQFFAPDAAESDSPVLLVKYRLP